MRMLNKSMLAVLALSVSAMLPLANANAGGPPPPYKHYGKWHKGPYPRWRPYYGPRPYWYGPRAYYGPPGGYYYGDGAVALGVLGLATGAIIGGAIADSNRPGSYNNPLPAPSAPPPPPAGYRTSGPAGSVEPWTDAWYRYCATKYRSFNASKGTYRGYDGRDHFCVVR